MSSESNDSSRPTSPAGTESEDVAELRARLDALLNDPLDAWLENMHIGGATAEFENTLSWKVTKPLRAVRTFQIRVGQLGLPGAVAHSARYARRRLGRR